MGVVYQKDFEKEIRKQERKAKLREARLNLENWFYNNKELALILIPAGIAAGGVLIKGGCKAINGAIRAHNLKKEESIKNLYCYDRSLGHYWSLRRELTNAEWVEIDKRKKNGERLADILSELKVLK